MLLKKQQDVNGLVINYRVKESFSAALTIIFIHGFPFDLSIWDQQLIALPRNVRGISYDIRGFGGSENGQPFFSIDLFSNDLLKFIEALKLDRVVLCGVSMGGYIALRTTEMSPERISGLILSDTNALADSNAAKIKRFASIEQITNGEKKAFVNEFVKSLFSPDTMFQHKEIVEMVKDIILKTSESTICSTLLALASRTETLGFLPEVKIPSLVIRGAEDKLMPQEQAYQMVEKLGHSEMVLIKGAGHLPNLEKPKHFNAAMNSFLAALI